MINVISTKGWMLVIGLVALVFLPPVAIHAQTGTATITVKACIDQNADGDCNPAIDPFPTTGVQACLSGSGCKDVPASFTNLLSGTYTAYLRFTGASEGYYPTTGQLSITLATGATESRSLGAVYPVHPKGVAIHETLGKVYVAFQGPIVAGEKPYPFVAVINGSDEVSYTIPGGTNSIGRSPWGVAVSGDNVYVGSFEDGRVTIIDATTDTFMVNIDKSDLNDPTKEFQPTAPYVDPSSGRVYFPDYKGGRVVILDGTSVVDDVNVLDVPPENGYSPFEMVTATKTGGTYNFVTLRDSVPTTFKFAGVDTVSPYDVTHTAINEGSPHAIGLWQEAGMTDDPRLFITYAADGATGDPNKLAVYNFTAADPKNTVSQVSTGTGLGSYAEAGLVYDAAADQMRGTYGGFLFDESSGSVTACSPTDRGGTYGLDYNGTVSAGFAPNVVVGNPPVISDTLHTLQWKNPFEIAINSSNGKVYVTDRCWNDYPNGGQPGGGAVLIYYSIDLPTIYLPLVVKDVIP